MPKNMLIENTTYDLLKGVLTRIKNELLLFSIAAVFLLVLFEGFKYYIILIYIIGSLLYFLSITANKKNNNKYLEEFDNLLENSSWRKEFIGHKEIFFSDNDNSYQIEIGEKEREFTEEWTRVYPDKAGSFLKMVYLKVGGVLVKQFSFISCDGGRILVPLPGVKLIKNKRVFQYDKNSLEYKLGKIIGDFYIYKTIEGVASMSGIKII